MFINRVVRFLPAFAIIRACFASHRWDYASQGEDWGALCAGKEQSPIDIQPTEVVESNVQVRMHYRPWLLGDVETIDPNASVPRVKFRSCCSPGKVQVGTGFDDFDEYALTALEIHSPSEHTFQQASWPVELQLWHEPLPLLRINDFVKDVADMSERSRVLDERFTHMQDLEEQLRHETEGEVAPWESMVAVSGSDEALDWIDTTKGKIETAGKKLHQEGTKQLDEATDLAKEAFSLVEAQRRPFAAHRVVISIFILRSPPEFLGAQNGSASQLIQWVSEAMMQSGHASEALDLNSILDVRLGESRNQFFAYEGSLTRPPCTPNVRWFVTAQPLAASVDDLEQLLAAARLGGGVVGATGDGVVGDAREIQPIGSSRALQRVSLSGKEFHKPELVLSTLASAGEKKWSFVQRYCKVFFMCSVFLLGTPFLFWLAKPCFNFDVYEEDEEDESKKPRGFEEEQGSDDDTMLPKVDASRSSGRSQADGAMVLQSLRERTRSGSGDGSRVPGAPGVEMLERQRSQSDSIIQVLAASSLSTPRGSAEESSGFSSFGVDSQDEEEKSQASNSKMLAEPLLSCKDPVQLTKGAAQSLQSLPEENSGQQA